MSIQQTSTKGPSAKPSGHKAGSGAQSARANNSSVKKAVRQTAGYENQKEIVSARDRGVGPGVATPDVEAENAEQNPLLQNHGGQNVAVYLDSTKAHYVAHYGAASWETIKGKLGRYAGISREAAEYTSQYGVNAPSPAELPPIIDCLAQLEYNNDREFGRQGRAWAADYQAVWAVGNALRIGESGAFSHSDAPLSSIQHTGAVLKEELSPEEDAPSSDGETVTAVEPSASAGGIGGASVGAHGVAAVAPSVSAERRSPKPRVGREPWRIKNLAIFTHGYSDGLLLGSWRTDTGAIASALSPHLTTDVNVVLFACSAAKGENSFAERLTEDLAEEGKTSAQVWGHTIAAHTTENVRLRSFKAKTSTNADGTTSTEIESSMFVDYLTDAQGQAVLFRKLSRSLGVRSQMVDGCLESICADLQSWWNGQRQNKHPQAEIAPMDPVGARSAVLDEYLGANVLPRIQAGVSGIQERSHYRRFMSEQLGTLLGSVFSSDDPSADAAAVTAAYDAWRLQTQARDKVDEMLPNAFGFPGMRAEEP